MKKIIVSVVVLAAVLGIALGVVYLVLLVSHSFYSPTSSYEKHGDLALEISNKTNSSLNLYGLELSDGSAIELRQLEDKLFIRLTGNINKKGKELDIPESWKLENSMYGKYSINLPKKQWNEFLDSEFASADCSAKVWSFMYSLPEDALFIKLSPASGGGFYQNMILQDYSTGVFLLEELVRRDYSSNRQGRHSANLFKCKTDYKNDKLSKLGYLLKAVGL